MTGSKPRRLTCCCCGESTKGRQWHNRDIGFGPCTKCAEWIKTRRSFGHTPMSAGEMHQNYGESGVHYNLA
ncbi:hypothetical protein LCGC14_2717380 [marine sediment metagenome]|uniref:Uncharacterized protein n=1 Tax=marine sediment metagenome TaxID=412755 RepID=A0A0F9C2X2_9ZZZZ